MGGGADSYKSRLDCQSSDLLSFFIFETCDREEIQRIKAANPEMPHREAFSTAAKNV